ncbi:MAG: Fic family protein [Bacilli bacterium]|nr:Fic family protein [Bacilli bacterium]
MNHKINFLNYENQEFYQDYFELLLNRLTHSNMSLEEDLGNPDDSKNAIKLRDNMNAFKLLLDYRKKGQPISEQIIMKTASKVNESALYISEYYRQSGTYLAETNIEITPPEEIPIKMEELLKRYSIEWAGLDPFEREAKFHIEFIKIHPFEDGNGRTSRLLLNYNLLCQGIAPAIITDDLLPYYHEYIKNSDFSSMENLFRIQSQKESVVFNQLYSEYQIVEQQSDYHR